MWEGISYIPFALFLLLLLVDDNTHPLEDVSVPNVLRGLHPEWTLSSVTISLNLTDSFCLSSVCQLWYHWLILEYQSRLHSWNWLPASNYFRIWSSNVLFPSLSLKIIYFLFYEHWFFCLHACLCEGVRLQGTGVTGRCELPCENWELNPKPLGG